MECPMCGEYGTTTLADMEQDGGKIYIIYNFKCPHCGACYRVSETYTWDGHTDMVKI